MTEPGDAVRGDRNGRNAGGGAAVADAAVADAEDREALFEALVSTHGSVAQAGERLARVTGDHREALGRMLTVRAGRVPYERTDRAIDAEFPEWQAPARARVQVALDLQAIALELPADGAQVAGARRGEAGGGRDATRGAPRAVGRLERLASLDAVLLEEAGGEPRGARRGGAGGAGGAARDGDADGGAGEIAALTRIQRVQLAETARVTLEQEAVREALTRVRAGRGPGEGDDPAAVAAAFEAACEAAARRVGPLERGLAAGQPLREVLRAEIALERSRLRADQRVEGQRRAGGPDGVGREGVGGASAGQDATPASPAAAAPERRDVRGPGIGGRG